MDIILSKISPFH